MSISRQAVKVSESTQINKIENKLIIFMVPQLTTTLREPVPFTLSYYKLRQLSRSILMLQYGHILMVCIYCFPERSKSAIQTNGDIIRQQQTPKTIRV